MTIQYTFFSPAKCVRTTFFIFTWHGTFYGEIWEGDSSFLHKNYLRYMYCTRALPNCWKIRGRYFKVDKIIANIKEVFLKAPSPVSVFKNKAPNILLLPEFILTRWVTWIRAAVYNCEHLEVLKSIIDSMDRKDAVSIINFKTIFLTWA